MAPSVTSKALLPDLATSEVTPPAIRNVGHRHHVLSASAHDRCRAMVLGDWRQSFIPLTSCRHRAADITTFTTRTRMKFDEGSMSSEIWQAERSPDQGIQFTQSSSARKDTRTETRSPK
jgi:hypothetical protein